MRSCAAVPEGSSELSMHGPSYYQSWVRKVKSVLTNCNNSFRTLLQFIFVYAGAISKAQPISGTAVTVEGSSAAPHVRGGRLKFIFRGAMGAVRAL